MSLDNRRVAVELTWITGRGVVVVMQAIAKRERSRRAHVAMRARYFAARFGWPLPTEVRE